MHKKFLPIILTIILFLFNSFSQVVALSNQSINNTTRIVKNFVVTVESKIQSLEGRIVVMKNVLNKIKEVEFKKASVIRNNVRLNDTLALIKRQVNAQLDTYKKELENSYSDTQVFNDIFGGSNNYQPTTENFRFNNGIISTDYMDNRYEYSLKIYYTNSDARMFSTNGYYPGVLNYKPVIITSRNFDLNSIDAGVDFLKTGTYKADIGKTLKGYESRGTTQVAEIENLDFKNPLDKASKNIKMNFYTDQRSIVKGKFTPKSGVSTYTMTLYRDYYSGEVKVGEKVHYNIIDEITTTSEESASILDNLVQKSIDRSKDNRYKVFMKGFDNNGKLKGYGELYFTGY